MSRSRIAPAPGDGASLCKVDTASLAEPLDN
jgi:hypothetical protein